DAWRGPAGAMARGPGRDADCWRGHRAPAAGDDDVRRAHAAGSRAARHQDAIRVRRSGREPAGRGRVPRTRHDPARDVVVPDREPGEADLQLPAEHDPHRWARRGARPGERVGSAADSAAELTEAALLTTEPPLYLINGLTILRDHEDLDLFYFPAVLPQLTSFTLYKYRVSVAADGSDPTRAPGAGLALFEVEIPPPNLALIQTELSSQTGREHPRLSPIPLSSADVHAIIAKTEGDKLFEDLVETHGAPLTSPYHTAFALALSAEGATLMQKAATAAPGDASALAIPVGVVYELRFLALTPALHARVTMNYEAAYNRFSASLAAQYYYVRAALDLDIAWLVEHDFIKIDIIAFTDAADADRQRAEVMTLVTARIQRDFFRSGLPPTQDSPAPTGPLA